MATPKFKHTDVDIEIAVAASTSLREVLLKLNAGLNGTSYTHFKNRIEIANISTLHFNKTNVVRIPKNKKSPAEILVNDQNKNVRSSARQLKRALLESGIDYMCAVCMSPPIHHNMPLVLQIDHINGDFKNNSIENLRFICPNCHTQTPTYGAKKIKKVNKNIKASNTYITEIMIFDALTDENIHSYTDLAKRLNKTIKTIRKYCKLYNILAPFNVNIISRDELEQAMIEYDSVMELLLGLSISKSYYHKLNKLYELNFPRKERNFIWITDGIEDKFISNTIDIPPNFKRGKTLNKPPIKQCKQNTFERIYASVIR